MNISSLWNDLLLQEDRGCAPSETWPARSGATPLVTPRAWCEAGPRARAPGTRTPRPTTAHAPRRGGASGATWAGTTRADTRAGWSGTRAARATRSTTASAQVTESHLERKQLLKTLFARESISLVFSGLNETCEKGKIILGENTRWGEILENIGNSL